ncbi:MAG: glycosyltransferase family 4 protein [Microbacteriaceae bacterium]|nr:glycosyltransferase family 4 protein [Burkholderiaceae bacterium]
MKTLCIEGWRGVSHSIALVNQYQMLVLLQQPQLQLYHRDLPFFLKHWNAQQMPAGFTAAEQARIDAVPAPPDDSVPDWLLRISSPFRSAVDPAVKTLTFMVTECGLVDDCFDLPPADPGVFTRGGNRIVTPSNWSRDRLLDYGIDPAGVAVVPHGVKTDVFNPMTAVERRLGRAALGIQDDDVLFVNVGVATWNKGLDILIQAFAHLRQRYPQARLLLKDHKALYGIGADRLLAQVARAHPGLVNGHVLAGISVISGSLDQPQLRALFGVADAYVSPYRAEGFNMPVLEAMACGTPVIVTGGGATDDFCPSAMATFLPSRPGTKADEPAMFGSFLVPDGDALVQAMTDVLEHRTPRDTAERSAAREQLVARYSWQAVTQRLMDVMDLRAPALAAEAALDTTA